MVATVVCDVRLRCGYDNLRLRWLLLCWVFVFCPVIIGGIVAYLLIGAVLVGLIIRLDKEDTNPTEHLWVGIMAWPVVIGIFLLASLVYFPTKVATSLAKRIGGVKD